MILLILIFIMGLVIGSFLNVIIHRLPNDKSIIFPASHCPNCNNKLKFYDLVPIFSYLFLRGKCRYCNSNISVQYPIIEFVSSLLFLFIYLKFGLSVETGIYLILVSILIVCSIIDFKYKIIPNKITYSGIILGLMLSILFNHITFISSILGMLFPAAFLLLIALIFKKGLGMGDVKLLAMIGTFIGYEFTFFGLFIGSFVGSIIGIVLISTNTIDRKTKIPFGPFISLGIVIILLAFEQLFHWYLMIFC